MSALHFLLLLREVREVDVPLDRFAQQLTISFSEILASLPKGCTKLLAPDARFLASRSPTVPRHAVAELPARLLAVCLVRGSIKTAPLP